MSNAIEWNNDMVLQLAKYAAITLVAIAIIVVALTGVGAAALGALGGAVAPLMVLL